MTEYEIPKLVEMVENGEIEIPNLQREFVWSDNQVRELAESVYRCIPIGLITLNKVRGQEKFWVLDGQQRLLSFVLIFNEKVEAIWKRKFQLRRITLWFDPKEEEFKVGKFKEGTPKGGGNWIRVSEVLKKKEGEIEDYLESLKEQGRIDRTGKINLKNLWNRFCGGTYKVLVDELPKGGRELEIDDLGEIFVRTNFAGTRVKGSDVYSTILAVTQEGVVKKLRDFCSKLPLELEIDYGILIRTFIAFLTNKVKLASKVFDQAEGLKREMKNNESQFEIIIEKVKRCTEEAIRLLKERGIMSKDYLPTQNVLPVMAYYLHKKGELSSGEKEGLFKWFVLASYFRRYSTSSETRLDKDISTIAEGGNYRSLIKNLEEKEGNLKERIKEDISKGAMGRLSKLLLYAILKQNQAKDLMTHDVLQTNNLTIHHIFPKSQLRGTKYEEMLDDIGNITLVTLNTNSSLSSRLPENYLRGIPPEIRAAHLIPSNQELWELEKCKDFIKERKEHLIEAVERFLNYSNNSQKDE